MSKVMRVSAASLAAIRRKAAAAPKHGVPTAKVVTRGQDCRSYSDVLNVLRTLPEDTWVGSGDGACQGNPGPCGAGAVLFRAGDYNDKTKWLTAHRALGPVGTNNTGELTAPEMIVELLPEGTPTGQRIEMFTDSKYAQGMFALGWKAKANEALIKRVADKLREHRVTLHWNKSHCGIPGNEEADRLAVLGVSESAKMPKTSAAAAGSSSAASAMTAGRGTKRKAATSSSPGGENDSGAGREPPLKRARITAPVMQQLPLPFVTPKNTAPPGSSDGHPSAV